jgi:hypothetical protein
MSDPPPANAGDIFAQWQDGTLTRALKSRGYQTRHGIAAPMIGIGWTFGYHCVARLFRGSGSEPRGTIAADTGTVRTPVLVRYPRLFSALVHPHLPCYGVQRSFTEAVTHLLIPCRTCLKHDLCGRADFPRGHAPTFVIVAQHS